MDNSVVNILPREKAPGLMRVRIGSFQWNTRDHVGVVIDRLFAMDSVSGFLVELRIASGLRSIIEPQQAPRVEGAPLQPVGQEYSLSDSTLLGALNRIVASYGNAVWVYTENHCGGKSEYDISAQ